MVNEVDLELPRIIAQAQTGESGAFGELYAKYAGLILRYLYARVRDQSTSSNQSPLSLLPSLSVTRVIGWPP